MAQVESNNSLYFIVGGIVVALVIGFFVIKNGSVGTSPSTTSTTTTSMRAADTDTTSTDIQVNENGASITQSTTE